MKSILIVIPVLAVVLFGGTAAYIVFAPDTFPKPIYIRINETSASAAPAGSPSNPAGTPPGLPTPPDSTDAGGGNVAIPLEPAWGIMYSLESKAVNLAEPGGLRYLQATVVLEFRPPGVDYHQLAAEERAKVDDSFKLTIDARRPAIDDLVMTILSSKTYKDIASLEGKQSLKDEISGGINNVLGYPAVMNVYFTEFIVQ
jgi:flagellar basal body-associated protein FliL